MGDELSQNVAAMNISNKSANNKINHVTNTLVSFHVFDKSVFILFLISKKQRPVSLGKAYNWVKIHDDEDRWKRMVYKMHRYNHVLANLQLYSM